MKFILGGLGNWHEHWGFILKAVLYGEQFGYWGAALPDHYMWRHEADLPPDVHPFYSG